MTHNQPDSEHKTLDENFDKEKYQLSRKLEQEGLEPWESLAFLECREAYRKALLLIGRYDQCLPEVPSIEKEKSHVFKAETAKILIKNLKKYLQEGGENVTRFGVKNTGDIDSVLGAVYQTYDGRDLYPDMESKASNLLYLLVKDHCFVDGNKRIAAFLFIWFLEINGKLYVAPEEPVISYILLYKLTIFIAKSNPKDKDLMIDLVSQIISFPREIPPESFFKNQRDHAVANG